jgi:hypothetical protein
MTATSTSPGAGRGVGTSRTCRDCGDLVLPAHVLEHRAFVREDHGRAVTVGNRERGGHRGVRVAGLSGVRRFSQLSAPSIGCGHGQRRTPVCRRQDRTGQRDNSAAACEFFFAQEEWGGHDSRTPAGLAGCHVPFRMVPDARRLPAPRWGHPAHRGNMSYVTFMFPHVQSFAYSGRKVIFVSMLPIVAHEMFHVTGA